MEWQDLLTDGYRWVQDTIQMVLNGLSKDELDWQPRPECNSIGWLAWHLTREQDAQIAALMGEEQLWLKDQWHARFNRPADAKDSGWSHKPEQVAAFKSPGIQALLGYHQAVMERTQQYFKALSSTELDRELDGPRLHPRSTVGSQLIRLLADIMMHAGQAHYVRGLLQGKWRQGKQQ